MQAGVEKAEAMAEECVPTSPPSPSSAYGISLIGFSHVQVSLFEKQEQCPGGLYNVHTEAPVHRGWATLRSTPAQFHLVSAAGCGRVSELGAGCVSVGSWVSLGVILGSYCSGKLAVFTVLCEQYQPSLRRDPMYNEVRLLPLAEAPHLGRSLEEGAERAAPAGPCGWTLFTC